MKRIAITLAIVAIPAVALGSYVVARRPPSPEAARVAFRSGAFDPPRPAPDFTLDGSNGAKVSLRDYRGKVVILEFGFSYCTQVCPVTLSHLTVAHQRLGAKASDVQVVFVTVDPDRDSPQRLHEFLAGFDRSFVGATGGDDELEGIRRAYGVFADAVYADAGVQVSHSSFVYLIDRDQRIRALVPFGTAVDDIVHDVGVLLAER